MQRPRLIIVTGEPGSGKSTLGRALAESLHVPYLSRDDVRWGLRASQGLWTNDMEHEAERGEAVEAFIQLVEKAAELGVTAVLEYMVFTWNPETLDRLRAAADCLVIVTIAADAEERANRRDLEDPLLSQRDVLAALGHDSVAEYLAGPGRERARTNMVSQFDLPTLEVNTDDGFEPSLHTIVQWVVSQTARTPP